MWTGAVVEQLKYLTVLTQVMVWQSNPITNLSYAAVWTNTFSNLLQKSSVCSELRGVSEVSSQFIFSIRSAALQSFIKPSS